MKKFVFATIFGLMLAVTGYDTQATPADLPDLNSFPIYISESCRRSSSSSANFKVETWRSGEITPFSEVVKITKISTGDEFTLYAKKVTFLRVYNGVREEGGVDFEHYYYIDKTRARVNEDVFYRVLFESFSPEDIILMTATNRDPALCDKI